MNAWLSLRAQAAGRTTAAVSGPFGGLQVCPPSCSSPKAGRYVTSPYDAPSDEEIMFSQQNKWAFSFVEELSGILNVMYRATLIVWVLGSYNIKFIVYAHRQCCADKAHKTLSSHQVDSTS
jgi:hypothetical protein